MNARGEYGIACAPHVAAFPYDTSQLVVSGVPLAFVLGLTVLALGGVAWWAYERSKKAGDQALDTAARADLVEDPQAKEALARQAFELAAKAREEADAHATQQAAEKGRRVTAEEARRVAAAQRAPQRLSAKQQAAAAAHALRTLQQLGDEARRAAEVRRVAVDEARRVAAEVVRQSTEQGKITWWRVYLERMAALGIPSEEILKSAQAAALEQKVKGGVEALAKAMRQSEAEKLAAVASGWW